MSDATAMRLFAPAGKPTTPEPLTVLSHGMGQHSTALGYMLADDEALRARYAPGRLLILAADTGNESAATYENAAFQEHFFAERGMHFELITADRGFHSPNWLSLEGFYASGDRIGSKAFPKTCSHRLKVDVVARRLERYFADEWGLSPSRKRGFREYVALTGQKVKMLIGFTADEADRRIKTDEQLPQWFRDCVERAYPLRDLGLTREDCSRYIRETGRPEVPPSFCRFCPFSTPFDVYHQWRYDPTSHERWAELERNKLRKFAHLGDRNHGVFPGKTLDEVLGEAREEFGHLSDAEMRARRMNHGHAVASRY